MRLFYTLLLFQFVFIGKLAGQNPFSQQHAKFMRVHTSTDTETLLVLLETEEKLIQKKENSSRLDKAQLALDRGIYFYMIDNYPKAISFFEQAARINSLVSNREEVILYTYLGVSYRNGLSDFHKAHQHLDQAIALAQKDCDLLASGMIKKADTYYYAGKFKQGIRLLTSFLKQKEQCLKPDRQIDIHSLLAHGYNTLGILDQSYTHYTKAVELANKTHNIQFISNTHQNFAYFFLNQQRYEEAKPLTLQVIRLLKDKPGFAADLHDSYAILGQIYSALNQLDSALYYANIAQAYALRTGHENSLFISYGTLGSVYLSKKEYAKALDYLLKSAAYEEKSADHSDLADSYHNIGLTYRYLENYRQAIAYLDKSNQLAYQQGDISTLYANYIDLVKADRGLGNFEHALAMQDSAFLYYDSLNNVERNKELLQLEVRYETKFKEQENKLLKLEVKRHQKARRDGLLLALAFILLLLGIVYILFISNRLKKSKVAAANAEIQNQKLEAKILVQRLDLLTEEINRKNQLIQSLEDETAAETEENLINKVTLENDWLAFMSEFDKTHRGYLAELKRQFPTLTTNHLRLAALVKLEFSNKEIAHIMSITENGVKKAKQRLKERIKTD